MLLNAIKNLCMMGLLVTEKELQLAVSHTLLITEGTVLAWM